MRSAIASLVFALAVVAHAAAQDPVQTVVSDESLLKALADKSSFEKAMSGELGKEPEDHVETDRDSFTPSTKTAGRSRFILESAYTFNDNRTASGTQSFPELLLRYGVTRRIELRLGWNAEIGDDPTIAGTLHEYRLSYGIKAALTDQAQWVPESAVIVQGFVPTGGDGTPTRFTAAYVFGWELPNKWLVDASIRYGLGDEEGEQTNSWAPSIVVKVPFGERWVAHVEYFGIFTRGNTVDNSANYISPGIHYLVTPNLEIGARVGFGLNEGADRFFVNAGVGWRY
jgi:hypothetical protein